MVSSSVTATKAGTVALVGRPNAGKSSLMNRFLGEKLAIVSDKPQTTRHRLIGIRTEERGQMVFHDTPGIHRPLHQMNRQMVRHATAALDDADAVCLLVDASEAFGSGDAYVLDLVSKSKTPKLLVLNKVDLVRKPKLLPRIQRYAETDAFAAIVPISALTGENCDALLAELWERLSVREPAYDSELYTVHRERFLAGERIREKVLEQTRDELPYTSAVVLDQWQEDPAKDLVVIHASILVERASQKKIVVGRGGLRIKEIGTAARLELEELIGRRVYLELHVRHEPDWRDNRRLLAAMEPFPDL